MSRRSSRGGNLSRDDIECIALRDVEIIELFRHTETLINEHKTSLAEFEVLADKAIFKMNEIKITMARFELDRIFAIGLLEFEQNKQIVKKLNDLIDKRINDNKDTTLAELQELLE